MTLTTDTMATGSTFALDLKALSTNLAFIKRVTGHTVAMGRRNPAVLSALRVSVSRSTVSLTYYNFETMATVRQFAEHGDDVAEFLVDVAEFATAVKAVGGKGVGQLTVSGSTLTLESDGMSVSAPLLSSKDSESAPDLPAVHDGETVVASGADLAAVGSTVAVGVSKDDTLPMLTGVKLEASREAVTFASTDRFKLAESTLDESANVIERIDTLIPGRALLAFAKHSSKADAVSVRVGDAVSRLTVDGHANVGYGSTAMVELSSGDATVIVRALDEHDFPKFRQLFPDASRVGARFTADGKALAARVKSVATGSRTIALDATADGVTARGLAVGHANEARSTAALPVADVELFDVAKVSSYDVGGTAATDGVLTVGYAADYLAEILATVPKGERVSVELTSPARPTVFTWTGHRALLMPVRLAGSE